MDKKRICYTNLVLNVIYCSIFIEKWKNDHTKGVYDDGQS